MQADPRQHDVGAILLHAVRLGGGREPAADGLEKEGEEVGGDEDVGVILRAEQRERGAVDEDAGSLLVVGNLGRG